ncbi:MAG: EAL domain-containing protein [Azonexus sp.]|jgi:diguanylate cyclase (GGDEF)-like protein|nr:EAL domain-containing protein [Azonexus sp.]
MTAKPLFNKLAVLFRAAPADPLVVTAQHRFFWSRVPWLYALLVAASWSVASAFMSNAPIWLCIGVPLALTLLAAYRSVSWWRTRYEVLTFGKIRTDLRRLNTLAVALTAALGAWAILLFRYATTLEQGLLVFYVALVMIGCVSILTYLRTLGLLMTISVNIVIACLTVQAGSSTFLAIAFIGLIVSTGILSAVWINYTNLETRILAQAELLRREEAQQRLLHMFDEMPINVITADRENLQINYMNETAKRTLRDWPHLISSADGGVDGSVDGGAIVGASIEALCQGVAEPQKLLADPGNLPFHTRIRSGPQVYDLLVSAITDHAGNYVGPMFAFSDITKEAQNEERIQHLALYDSLTGLANRPALLASLENSLATPGAVTGLLYIDLDGFKVINDAQGHSAGDELLKLVADRLREACNLANMTLGRIGGDEFVVLLHDTHIDQLTTIADTLIARLSVPYTLGSDRRVSNRHSRHKSFPRERRARVGASIGCAIAPEHGHSITELLARADMALYAAKDQGKGRFCLFSSDMEVQALARLNLETRLREALELNSGLFVFYQPIIDIESKRITCQEALLRWHHPLLGWIPPTEFIPVAEECGLIEQIGQFVLERACREALGWTNLARVAVNISAAQLGKGTLVEVIKGALAQSGLAAPRLEIEITETALIRNQNMVVKELEALKKIGVRIALDDFGTGFSSFTLVRAFPFDKIKIDGSFISEAITRADCAAIVNAIAQLGKHLDITIVAEKVETGEQLAFVTEAACAEAQGYLFAEPAPCANDVAEVERINRRRPPHPAADATSPPPEDQ